MPFYLPQYPRRKIKFPADSPSIHQAAFSVNAQVSCSLLFLPRGRNYRIYPHAPPLNSRDLTSLPAALFQIFFIGYFLFCPAGLLPRPSGAVLNPQTAPELRWY
jgi:hypothetical protein